MRPYFNNHAHTMYSNLRLLDCINRPKELINKAIELGMSGIAITDHECLSAHMEVNQYAKEIDPNFKVALGNEIYLTNDRSTGQKYYHFILIAKDFEGYKALRKLSTIAWYNSYVDRRMERVPVTKEELSYVVNKYKGHLIACSACIGSEFGTYAYNICLAESVEDKDNAQLYYNKLDEFLKYVLNLFGDDFYIECAPSSYNDQIMVNKKSYEIAKKYNIKMTVGTDAHYLRPEDREIHKAYLNSKGGEREVSSFYEYTYLMTSNEIKELLSSCIPPDEINKIFDNTLEIQNKIEYYDLSHKQKVPKVKVKYYNKVKWVSEQTKEFPTLAQLFVSDDEQERYWVNECFNTLEEKGLKNKRYLDRLELEASTIKLIGDKLDDCLFAYFNTLKHYIDLFWECGSILGPGRGSATGFLSNYLLGLTQLDSIRWGLYSWRFLNPERVELPSL